MIEGDKHQINIRQEVSFFTFLIGQVIWVGFNKWMWMSHNRVTQSHKSIE